MTLSAGSELRRVRRHSIILLLLAAAILIPLGIVAGSLFAPGSEIWRHIRGTLLSFYLKETLLLSLGVLAATVVIGSTAAWITVRYDFPLKDFLAGALAIPLAMPAYVGAFAWAGIFDFSGPWQRLMRSIPGLESGYPVPEIMSTGGAVWVMSLALYPYIYLPVRSAFRGRSGGAYEAAAVLGAGEGRLFFRIALPLARPALTGGGILVLMEVLNEYGAVHYFGVSTLSVGIFRAWFSLGDLVSAMKLSSALLILVLALLLGERALRGRRGYAAGGSRPQRPVPLRGAAAAAAVLACGLPFLFGFLIPAAQLLWWAAGSLRESVDMRFLRQAVNTLLLAGGSTALILATAVVAGHLLRRPALRFRRPLTSMLTLGYAIPGAVVAVGIMTGAGLFDSAVNRLAGSLGGGEPGLILSGSMTALVAAYLIRYLGVAFNPVEAGFQQLSGSISEASRTLGHSPPATLIKIDLPTLSPALKAAALMTAIDLLKELPLTLVLRPFNFETLATRAYEMAGDERLSLAALPSLLIIAAGMIPILFWTTRSSRGGKR